MTVPGPPSHERTIGSSLLASAVTLAIVVSGAAGEPLSPTEEGSLLFLWLADQLVRFGPIILFVICLLETAVFVGLVLPVGALIGFGALLAARGVMDPATVATAAMAGALIGDQLGFTAGRWFPVQVRPARGGITRLWQGGLQRAQALLNRRGLVGVSAARAVPFARTIMPWLAGRSGMTWPRFLLFDLIGVLAWATVYLGGGFLAGYGWHAVAGRFGELAGAAILLVGVSALAVAFRLWIGRFVHRRRMLREVPDRQDHERGR